MTSPTSQISGTLLEATKELRDTGFSQLKILAKQTGTGTQQTLPHSLSVTPTANKVLLTEADTGLAIPYQSAAPDATNVYVTAVNAKTYNVLIFYP